MAEYRVNQRVCRIRWRDGRPYIAFGQVTKTTARTYYVDGAATGSSGWCASWQDAITEEYVTLFADWGLLTGQALRRPGWSVEKTITCVCRLRRMERRLIRRAK